MTASDREIDFLNMSDAFYQRFVDPNVCARSVCSAAREGESRKIVFYIHFIEMLDMRSMTATDVVQAARSTFAFDS